jgi:glycine/D-amino acid oxidase-like deaminating enzyme
MQTIKTDILIMGGGVAGLWLLNVLRKAGYSVLLLENERLGGVQTLNANGILHGGMKFGLAAMLGDAEALDDMPALWRDCFQGKGDLDLSGVRVLSEMQYLWSEANLAARTTTFFASRLLTGKIESLDEHSRPLALASDRFGGVVYKLNDQVVDCASLVQKLAQPYKNCIYKVSAQTCHLEADDRHNTTAVFITAAGIEPLRIHPRRVILAGGGGNEGLLADLGLREPEMVRRHLHMVLIKHPQLMPFYGHCLGASNKPRLTITTHPTRDGQAVWYLGGELAEDGAVRDERLQIEEAQHELKELLPWVDLRGARYKTLKIDRILPAESSLIPGDNLLKFKATTAFVEAKGNNIVAWPCKLTLTPNMGRQVLQCLEKDDIRPEHPQHPEPLPLLYPEMGLPAWETLFT